VEDVLLPHATSATSLAHRRKQQVARTLALDRAAIEVLRAFAAADVPALLLKGASFRTWLYRNEGRAQIDVDILVPEEQWAQAVQVVESLGFVPHRHGLTGGNWYRDTDRLWLDLHRTLFGVRVPPSILWARLWRERDTMDLHRVTVPILNEPARLFNVVMHAIQTGNRKTKAVQDLTRAAEIVSFAHWQKAWELAASLWVADRFASSLRLYAPSGAELADRLGASRRVRFLECAQAIEAAPAAVALAEWLDGNWRQRGTILKRWVWPGTDVMADLEHGLIPLPMWIRHCPSRLVKFYLWRGFQVFSFLWRCPAALRLRQTSDRAAYRQSISQPWWDDR
jgi:Uncharacterised nucleotidyltransferase